MLQRPAGGSGESGAARADSRVGPARRRDRNPRARETPPGDRRSPPRRNLRGACDVPTTDRGPCGGRRGSLRRGGDPGMPDSRRVGTCADRRSRALRVRPARGWHVRVPRPDAAPAGPATRPDRRRRDALDPAAPAASGGLGTPVARPVHAARGAGRTVREGRGRCGPARRGRLGRDRPRGDARPRPLPHRRGGTLPSRRAPGGRSPRRAVDPAGACHRAVLGDARGTACRERGERGRGAPSRTLTGSAGRVPEPGRSRARAGRVGCAR